MNDKITSRKLEYLCDTVTWKRFDYVPVVVYTYLFRIGPFLNVIVEFADGDVMSVVLSQDDYPENREIHFLNIDTMSKLKKLIKTLRDLED